MIKSLIWVFLPLAARAGPNPDTALQANAAERPIDGIMDNSFFIEEAYNQEPGVVQHILTGFGNANRLSGPDDRAWGLSFTQEWPVFSQKHQFSYTVLYSFLESGGVQSNGVGDVLLNYRFQALFNPKPIGLTGSAPDYGVFLYVSFEHAFLKQESVR